MTAGTSWYDCQQHGSSGRMLAADESGALHLTWTKSFDSNLYYSHVFYNIWNADNSSFLWNGGLQVDAASRASYVTQATTPDGRCYPLYNGAQSAQSAIDFLPRAGAFTANALCLPNGEESLSYPMTALDGEGALHVLAVGEGQTSLITSPSALYYLRGQPELDESGFGIQINWENIGTGDCATMLDSVAIRGSRRSGSSRAPSSLPPFPIATTTCTSRPPRTAATTGRRRRTSRTSQSRTGNARPAICARAITTPSASSRT
jgi:hypothetical protein